METIARRIVKLRTELGYQHSKAFKELEALEQPENDGSDESKRQYKLIIQAEGRIARLQKATEALGAIQLGDVEDDVEDLIKQ